MTDERKPLGLEPIKEREARATDGPWQWRDWSHIGEGEGPNQFTLEAPPECHPDGPSEMFADLPYRITCYDDQEISEENKTFIAHARQDIPALIAEVEALRKELDEQKSTVRELLLCE